jgi:two-component system, response regulator
MTEPLKSIVILMADDDEEDRMLARDALREARLANDLRFVTDGEALMAYLRHQPPFAGPGNAPTPGLILLDLKMPKKNGYEVLQEIRSDPALRRIPVVALTTSKSEEDIARTYDLGVNSFIIKPVTFEGLVETMRELGRYWFRLVELPAPPEGD